MAVAFFALRRRRRVEREFRRRVQLDDLRDIDLISRYRLDRDGIEYLHQIMADGLKRRTSRSDPIPAMTQVLAGLRYLAKGDSLSEVGDLHGISKTTMSGVLDRFMEVLNLNLDTIRFPVSAESQRPIKIQFHQRCGIPNVIGAIDGTLIPILAPKEDEAAFVCRKGYHAMNVQAVVDGNMRFVDVVAKWPGSTHDASIFDNCGLKDHLERNPGSHLLGDSGYPLRPYLLTPFLRPTTDAERRFNDAQSRGRVVVERTFGVLKARFRCLHKTGGVLPFQPEKCTRIIVACMKMHNLCVDRKIPFRLQPVVNNDQQAVTQEAAAGSGIAKRQSIVRLFQ